MKIWMPKFLPKTTCWEDKIIFLLLVVVVICVLTFPLAFYFSEPRPRATGINHTGLSIPGMDCKLVRQETDGNVTKGIWECFKREQDETTTY